MVIAFGCKPTRLLSDDQYLLQKNKIVLDGKSIDKRELEGYYRQKPNKRTLVLFKLPLAAYNFSRLGKERKWKNWLGRVVGEEPSIYDSLLVDRTSQQFKRYLYNEAYYNAEVSQMVKLKRQRAKVTYYIKANTPIMVSKLNYQINDSLLAPIILSDTANAALKPGKLFTLEALQQERSRIVLQFKDSGYYYFNQEDIKYQVDTTGYKANIRLIVNKEIHYDFENHPYKLNHRQYWINKVYFFPDFDPQLAIRQKQNYFQNSDTVYHDGFPVIYAGKKNIRPKVVLKANAIYPNNRYNYTDVLATTKYLNSLRLFRLSNINFVPVFGNDSLLNCQIKLTPATYQNFSVNFETTTTQGNYGLGGYLSYQNRNLFKGAELLNIKLSGSYQRQNKSEDNAAFNIVEYGLNASLETPSFILPFRMERFYKRYNPKTTFSLVYNVQQKPGFYNRDIYGISMGYVWKGKRNIRHVVNPFDFSAVNILFDASGNFEQAIVGTYLENNFKDYFIAGGNYSLIFQNKGKTNKYSHSYLRWNVGFAGNLLNTLYRDIFHKDTVAGGYYEVLNLQFAQYAQTDIDIRHFGYFNKNNLIAMRFFAGVAVPIKNGNASAIPFVKQYHAGGAQGIRAWHMYDLGPGTYNLPDSVNSFQTADIKLELNLEYRFSFSRSWKGAFFTDIGNIWSISEADDRPGAFFKRNEFYKQFAIGTGFGVRYDLQFAVIRLDWGIKVKDPAIPGAESWVLFKTPFKLSEDLNWHFAIGYPF